MLYRLKVVFVDNEEVVLEKTEKPGFSDDLELFAFPIPTIRL